MTNRWIASYEMADDGDYLEHYGRLGMKWGQHIFGKDPDKIAKRDKTKKRKVSKFATAALATTAATATAIAAASQGKSKALDKTIKQGKDKPNISTAEKTSKELSNIVNNFNTIYKSTSKSYNTDDLTNLSDEEIRKIINRKNLEKQYRSVMESENTESYERVQDILNTVGAGIAVVGSGLAIAASIKTLRGG